MLLSIGGFYKFQMTGFLLRSMIQNALNRRQKRFIRRVGGQIKANEVPLSIIISYIVDCDWPVIWKLMNSARVHGTVAKIVACKEETTLINNWSHLKVFLYVCFHGFASVLIKVIMILPCRWLLHSKKCNVRLPYVKHALTVRYKMYIKRIDGAPYILPHVIHAFWKTCVKRLVWETCILPSPWNDLLC